MRRLFPLLCAAGLAVAPSLAAADRAPADRAPADRAPRIETFEWSTMTSRGRLGVMVIGITPELRKHFGAADDRGILVGRVEPRSDAEAAGLRVGDVIVEVRGSAITSASDVLSALGSVKQGDTVSLTVVRDGKPLTLQAKMTSAPSADAAPPRWLDDWFDDFRRRFREPGASGRPDWLDDLFRPWRELERDGNRGGERSTRT